jgi:hypothetical protein
MPRQTKAPARGRSSVALAAIITGTIGATLALAPQARSICPNNPILQNVSWLVANKLSACPAGDSVAAGIQSRIRVQLTYNDANCNPKVGVPPESIYVTFQTISGNAKVNDEAGGTNAVDNTDASGFTRILAPSVSGGGKLRVRLFVSGADEGFVDVSVHTVDSLQTWPLSVGRVTPDDSTSASDVNFDGVVNQTDRDIVHSHMQHWHRNALHGSLVKRTSLDGSTNLLGAGRVFWSPSGRYISYSQHDSATAPCQVYLVPSNPNDGGNGLWKVPTAVADEYDPSWSPLNSTIIYGQEDTTIYAYSLPNFGGDGTTHVVTAWNDGDPFNPEGASVATVSPDGQWVVFNRRTVPPDPQHNIIGPFELYKVPISGDASQIHKLTKLNTDGTDFYPQWSPDGVYIIFQRETGDQYGLYRVRADGDSSQTVDSLYTITHGKPTAYVATTPDYSPDGLIVTTGIGPLPASNCQVPCVTSVVTRTLDPSLSAKPAIVNYPDFPYVAAQSIVVQFPILSPILSPDGTRLALGSKNIWAARRNMNLPPRFTNVGGTINDTTSVVNKSATVGTLLSFTVTASDAPETDTLTYAASFLQDGMTFNSPTFSWTPSSASCGKTDYVKFLVTEASGGTDAVIVKIAVASCGPHASAVAARDAVAQEISIKGPNPTRGVFAISTPMVRGVSARLSIFDLSGRQIAVVQSPSGVDVVWRGTDSSGRPAPEGIYLYRLDLGSARKQGRIVVVR